MLDLDRVGNASSYTLAVLRALAADNLDNLCFVDFPARHGYAALDALYPKHAKYGQRNPPASELETGAAVRRWRTISKGNQQHIIDNPPAPVTRGSSCRASRRERRMSLFQTDQLDQVAAHPASSPLVMEEGHGGDDEPHSASFESEGQGGDAELDGASSESFSEPDEDLLDPSPCCGISEAVISAISGDKDTLLAGFWNAYGNAGRVKCSHMSRHRGKYWPFGHDVVGVLIDPRNESDLLDNYTWRCVHEATNPATWHHRECTNVPTTAGSGICTECWRLRHKLYTHFRTEVDFRTQGVPRQMNEMLLRFRSPTVKEPIEMAKNERIDLQRRQMWHRDRRCEAFLEKLEVSANLDWDSLFNPKELKKLYKEMCSKEEVTDKEVMDYLFRECMAVHARMKENGNAFGHRYSALTIRFACMLRGKMSQSSYDFYRKTFGLPCNSTLLEYSAADSDAPDGCMMETIAQVSQLADESDLPDADFGREGNLSWDSHTIRDKLQFSFGSGNLTGYAADAFNLDAIVEQFKKMSDENLDDDKKTSTLDKVPLGKHYMVFYFTTYSGKQRPFCFMAARYCLASLSARWIVMEMQHIIATLATFGFVVNTLGCDGASENRSALKQQLNISLRDAFPELMTDDNPRQTMIAPVKKYDKDDLPWDMKVAIIHPTFPDVHVFAGADMGHAVKKQRNAAFLTGFHEKKRNLLLHGLPLALKMLQEAWEKCPDKCDESAIMIFRKIKLEIFDLNANTMLRTPHAMKIYSSTMLSVLHFYKDKNQLAAAGAYDSWIEWITVMDRFVDIMNGTRDKGCELIDCADHRHVYELLDVVRFFNKWKNENASSENLTKWNFLPISTFEDTVWTCLGIVGVARKQLRGGHNIVQRRHGSDVCEESFCFKRSKNANADALNTNHILARHSHSSVSHLAASRKANFGKKRTFHGHELDTGKIKRMRIKRKGSKSIHR